MPDYSFYRDIYLGSTLPENRFPELILRAQEWLNKLERNCRVVPYGADSRQMALCAVAEALSDWRKTQGIAQATLGSVNLRYEHSDITLQRRLLQSAAGYMDSHRGIC